MFGIETTADSTVAQPTYREITVNASAYTANEGGPLGAWGDVLKVGHVAADDLPYNTVVIIGEREYVVKDRFGGGYRNRIDIFMESEAEAWEFGRRELKIYVKEENNGSNH